MTMDNNTVTVLLVLIIVAGIVTYRLVNRPPAPPTAPPVARDPQAQQIIAEIQQLRDELRREATSNGFTVPANREGM